MPAPKMIKSAIITRSNLDTTGLPPAVPERWLLARLLEGEIVSGAGDGDRTHGPLLGNQRGRLCGPSTPLSDSGKASLDSRQDT